MSLRKNNSTDPPSYEQLYNDAKKIEEKLSTERNKKDENLTFRPKITKKAQRSQSQVVYIIIIYRNLMINY